VDTSHTQHTFDELQEGMNYTFTVNQTGFGGCGVFSTGPVYAMTFTAGAYVCSLVPRPSVLRVWERD